MALFSRTTTKDADGNRVRIPRKDRRGASPVVVAVVVGALLLAITYLGFTKDIPFTTGYRLNAVFANANSIRPNSPVRIAGVNIGKVKDIERYKDTNASVVTMELDKKALPIHKDAEVKIRPRIFLEGNFFVDIRPGTPESPVVGSGDTLPMTQTAAPVQFGDVLTALQSDTRKNLQDTLANFGSALTRKPSATDDRNADPDVRGQSAAQSLNDNYDNAAPALRATSIVNEALLGTEPHDLSKIIKNLATITTALDSNEATLKDFVTNFNGTLKIFADEKTNLRATIRGLPPFLRTTNRVLGDLNGSFPATRAFARDILPGVRETRATIDASFPFIRQTRALLQPSELRGLAQELSPATRDLARTIDAATSFLPQQDLAAKCLDRVILPTGDVKIADGPLSTGVENYKEFWYSMVGLAGEGQNFDGNGMYVRFQPGGGLQTLSTGKSSLSGDTLFGRNDAKPIGNRPAYPGKRPPYRPDVPCYTNKLPDLNGAATAPADASKPSSDATGLDGLLGGLLGGGGLKLPTVPGLPPVTVPTPVLPALPAVPAVPAVPGVGGAAARKAAAKSAAPPTKPPDPKAGTP